MKKYHSEYLLQIEREHKEHEELMRELSWPYIIGWWNIVKMMVIAFVLPLELVILFHVIGL